MTGIEYLVVQVSDGFRDFVCSLFPKAILFYFYSCVSPNFRQINITDSGF